MISSIEMHQTEDKFPAVYEISTSTIDQGNTYDKLFNSSTELIDHMNLELGKKGVLFVNAHETYHDPKDFKEV